MAGGRGGCSEVRARRMASEAPWVKMIKVLVSHARECGLYPAENGKPVKALKQGCEMMRFLF